RLGRWGAQTCVVSDTAVAQALLPERTWQAGLLDHALGPEEVEALAEAAKPYARHRIVMIAPASRHELRSASTASSLTGYLVKPLRAASLAARLIADETAAPEIAAGAMVELSDETEVKVTTATRGLSVLVAEGDEIEALLTRSLMTRLGTTR